MERGKQIADRFVSSFWRVLTVCVWGEQARQGKARRMSAKADGSKHHQVEECEAESRERRAECGES